VREKKEPREREPLRNIRVSDELWASMQDAVTRRGHPSVSHILRTAMEHYVQATNRMEAEGRLPHQRSEPSSLRNPTRRESST
jgi:hypothetical protein